MASALGLGVLLVTTTLMGSADDQGRAGRFLVRQCSNEAWARNGPWPGSFYSVPLGIAVVVAATGVMVAASLSGVALVAGIRLVGIACPPVSWTVLGIVLLAVGTLMLLLTSWCLALLLAGRRVPLVESRATAAAGQATSR